MPCSSCKKSESKFETKSELVNQDSSKFTTEGSVPIIQSQDTFISLANTIPLISSAANSLIITKSSQNDQKGFSPTFFNISYIDSVVTNIENGNYQSSSTTEDNQIITNYLIPYNTDTGEKILNLTTILDSTTNITFYTVPRDLTYNSVKEASVAIVPNGKNYIGKINIPRNFYSTNQKKVGFLFNLNIITDLDLQTYNVTSTSITCNCQCFDLKYTCGGFDSFGFVFCGCCQSPDLYYSICY
jgi:hypothetical protein